MDARFTDQSPEGDLALESLKIYFDDAELGNMSEYEKKRFAKIKRNYENLVNMGVNPAMPNFMLRKKRTDHAVCFGAEKSVHPTVPNFVPRKQTAKGAACSGGGAEKSKAKRPRNDRSFAPSSSIKMLKDIQQEFPRPTMEMLNNHSVSYNIKSPVIPTNLKKCQITHKSEYLNGVINDLSMEATLGDKYAIEKGNGIDSVADENAIPRKKHVVFSNRKKTDHKLHACAQCDYTAGNSAVLKTHFDAVHNGKRPYKCKQCDYRSSYISNLRKHVNAVHEGLKPYKCQQCDYRASEAINLRYHVNAVHEGLKPYKWQQCDYRASRAITLRNHVNAVHEGLKLYNCQQCDYRAYRATDLQKHANAVHEGVKPYSCKMCEYKTARSSHLRRHQRRKHSVMNNTETPEVEI